MPEKMTTKEKVFAAIQRRGAAGPTPIMQVAKASADQLKVIIGELEREGKIKSWPYRGRSGMTAIYTLPDAKDPRTKEMVDGKRQAEGKKAVPAKAGPVAPSVPGNGGPKSTPRPAKAAALAGGTLFGSVAAVIADLEARKAKIDNAIETLRALG